MEETQQVYKHLKQGDEGMDIERLKKLNLLAGELKHQGIAQNHEDAAYLAVNMIGEEEEQCLSDMYVGQEESVETKEKVPTPTIIQSGITKEDIEKVMQSFATAIVAEFSILQKKIEETNQQLAQLQQKISEQVVIQQAVPQQKMIQFMEESPIQTQVREAANPRTGSFDTDDVCIEKMFYCGAK